MRMSLAYYGCSKPGLAERLTFHYDPGFLSQFRSLIHLRRKVSFGPQYEMTSTVVVQKTIACVAYEHFTSSGPGRPDQMVPVAWYAPGRELRLEELAVMLSRAFKPISPNICDPFGPFGAWKREEEWGACSEEVQTKLHTAEKDYGHFRSTMPDRETAVPKSFLLCRWNSSPTASQVAFAAWWVYATLHNENWGVRTPELAILCDRYRPVSELSLNPEYYRSISGSSMWPGLESIVRTNLNHDDKYNGGVVLAHAASEYEEIIGPSLVESIPVSWMPYQASPEESRRDKERKEQLWLVEKERYEIECQRQRKKEQVARKERLRQAQEKWDVLPWYTRLKRRCHGQRRPDSL